MERKTCRSGPDLTTAHKSHSREPERSGSSELTDRETGPSSVARKSTGPRTTAGKQKSRYNALKSGIFAKVVLLKRESPTEYGSLLNGLREDLQPQGTLEAALVENLAALLWRKRRLLRAESAEITNAVEFMSLDSGQPKLLEAWDRCPREKLQVECSDIVQIRF
jgi:hypothetical protein